MHTFQISLVLLLLLSGMVHAAPAPVTAEKSALPTSAVTSKTQPEAERRPAAAPTLQPTSRPQLRPTFKPMLQARNITLNASKVRASFEGPYPTKLSWEMDLINQSNMALPAGTLEYQVLQTRNGSQPVVMLKGSVNQAMPMGSKITLNNSIYLCCDYNRIEIKVKDKMTGKVLVDTASPLPVESARAKVQVVEAKYRLQPKPAAAITTLKNTSVMPIRVKAVLSRKVNGAFVRVDEKTTWLYPNATHAINWRQKVGAFDEIRVELSQDCVAIMCPKSLCVDFPTFEGNLMGM